MLDYKKIDDIVVDTPCQGDAPDFCDAYIISAKYDDPIKGYRDLTEEELDGLDSDWVHDQVTEWMLEGFH